MAMREANLPPHIYQIKEDTRPPNDNDSGAPREHLAEPAKAAAYQIWSEPSSPNSLPQPTAAFCFNDVVAMGVYKALRDLSRHIPDDVSLISVDNLVTVQHFEVPLSTFALPGESIGLRSADILLRRLAGNVSKPEQVLLSAAFIIRASTAPR
jgi:DNA-binding LacI/PurR family transcriptional regulator